MSDVVLGALLRHIGCTGFAVEEAHRYGAGDDVALRAVLAEVDFGQQDKATSIIGFRLAAAAPPEDRARALHRFATEGPLAGQRHEAAQCDAAERLGALLPVSLQVRTVASDAFERWDGTGGPQGKAGEELSVVARVVEVAYVAELFRSRQGRGGALAELRSRSGGQLDPSLVARLLQQAGGFFDHLDDQTGSVWDKLLDAERVAERAGQTAEVLGVGPDARRELGQAALLHDLGRVGVPTGLWDLSRQLSPHERDRARFHAWETARILGATPLFSALAQVAGAAHERLDGSGYHRGTAGSSLSRSARILEAADVWCPAGRPDPIARNSTRRELGR